MVRKNNILNFVNSLVEQKHIDKELIKDILESIFVRLYNKKIDADAEVKCVFDIEAKEINLYVKKEIVDKVEDEYSQISAKDKYVIKNKYKTGDQEFIPFDFDDFPESAFTQVNQMFRQNLKEQEENATYEKYKPLIGKIIKAKIYKVSPASVLAILGNNDTVAYMSKGEMPFNTKYEVDDYLDFYVLDVDKISKNSQIKISRVHPNLLRSIIEREISEVAEGKVVIHDIARIAGERAKVSVSSTDKNIEPVGTLIGPRGINSRKISELLDNERIDVIRYHEDVSKYIAEALSPAKVISVVKSETETINSQTGEKEFSRKAIVIVPDNELVQAIGKGGVNVKLAVKLTNYNIDIKTESKALEENIEYEVSPEFSYKNREDNIDEQVELIDFDELEEIANETGFQGQIDIVEEAGKVKNFDSSNDYDDIEIDDENVY